MRFSGVVVAALWLGACGARGSNRPAWPERAEREADGGESIAPRESTTVAAVEAADGDDTAVIAPPAAAAAPAGAGTTPATTTTTITAPEDTITVEEIVIEISDDSD